MRVFLYPMSHGNEIINITKKHIASLGFSVSSFWALFSLRNLKSRRFNKVILNWYEDQPYRQNTSLLKRVGMYVTYILFILIAPLFSSKIIWVRHNLKPHNVIRKPLSYEFLLWCISISATEVVTLEESTSIKGSVVPHPLYCSDSQLNKIIGHLKNNKRLYDFVFFGAIKPYKRLNELLASWPSGIQLKIVGMCSSHKYERALRNIIKERSLDVFWDNEYLSSDSLNDIISNARYVILSHDDGAMVSSGTFYHAISYGANIVTMPSVFGISKSIRHSFVSQIDFSNMETTLKALPYRSAEDVMNESLRFYGEQHIRSSWEGILCR